MTPGVRADIERITFLWRDCRKRFSGAFQKDEGFLFGTFGAADAMFAPVATRFKTYGVTLDNDADAYCKAVLAHPAMKEWIDAAEHEQDRTRAGDAREPQAVIARSLRDGRINGIARGKLFRAHRRSV